MIFLALDFLSYKKLSGRYGNGEQSMLPDMFEESIPDGVISILKPGDQIWMHSTKSIRSWLIMYYCRVPLSHASIYAGNRSIIHSTPDKGVVKQDLDQLFGRGIRFLPCRYMQGEKREEVVKETERLLGIPYTFKNLSRAWLYIITGRNWGTFNWRFFADFMVLFLTLDVVLGYFWSVHVFFAVAACYTGLVSVFGLLWKYKPIPFNTQFLSLNMVFFEFFLNGLMPLINKVSSVDEVEVLGAYREKK